MVGALLDRVRHRCTTIRIDGHHTTLVRKPR